MIYNNEILTDSVAIATAFNAFFKSVFKPLTFLSSLSNYLLSFISDIYDVPIFHIPFIDSDQMKNQILMLNPNTSSGYEKLSVTFLINCADDLCVPLSILFNMCIEKGQYPDILKKCNITPIFKNKGVKEDVINYRGISIEPIISKLFQSLVKKHLIAHIERLVSPDQHGFLPGRSTTTNLTCYQDFISTQLDLKNQVHAVYTDFQKAFDVVPHDLLIKKLYCNFGFRDNVLLFFHSFLSNRFQRVVINGVESQWTSVTSGVPQGSILGPLLFIMYINDVSSVFKFSKCLLFADDAKIFKSISNISDCIELQTDLNSFQNWCTEWKLYLNLDKCLVMNFSLKKCHNIVFSYCLHGFTLPYEIEVKDLGVYFTPKLNFKRHVSYIVSKAFKMLGFMNRVTKPFTDETVLRTLYFSYVRSRLEYCSQVWAPTAQIYVNTIERVQRKFIKKLCFLKNINYDTNDYLLNCDYFRIQPLSARRNVADIVFFNKILTQKINCSTLVSEILLYAPERPLRRNISRSTFYVKCRTCTRKESFMPRVMTLLNNHNCIDCFIESTAVLKRTAYTVFF